MPLATGTNGQQGNGVYSVDANGKGASPKVVRILAQLRSQGVVKAIQENIDRDMGMALSHSEMGIKPERVEQ